MEGWWAARGRSQSLRVEARLPSLLSEVGAYCSYTRSGIQTGRALGNSVSSDADTQVSCWAAWSCRGRAGVRADGMRPSSSTGVKGVDFSMTPKLEFEALEVKWF